MKHGISDYLSHPFEVEEQYKIFTLKSILLLISGFFAVTLLWCGLTTIPEVAQTEGEIVPIDRVHNIQHVDGGIIKSLSIKNNDQVEKGQLLVELDDSILLTNLQEKQQTLSTLKLRVIRLEALLNGLKPEFTSSSASAQAIDVESVLFKEQYALKIARDKHFESRLFDIEQEILAKRHQYDTANQELSVLSEKSQMRKSLYDNKQLSKTNYLEAIEREMSANTRLAEVSSEVTAAMSQKNRVIYDKDTQDKQWREELSRQLNDTVSELHLVDQKISDIQLRLDRLMVRSPVNGIVKGLDKFGVNSVIGASEVFLEIVPTDNDLIVEAKVRPEDVGHLAKGSAVDIKVSSFEYQKFGSVPGVLNKVSASTYLDHDGRPYYLAEISLKKKHVGTKSNKHTILPGMTVSANIITGEKSILDYLLKPLYRGFNGALSER